MTVQYDVRDKVAHLTLDRPEAFNAIDRATALALLDTALAVRADRQVRAVLVRGAGRAFCGGGDVKGMAAVADEDPDGPAGLPASIGEITTYLHAAISTLVHLDVPVVAAVHGSAAGAGMSLALACDLVLAAEGTRFTMAYTAIGMAPDGASTWFLPRLVGLRRAVELTLTNRVLDAAEAEALGIVTRVVAADVLDAEAESLCADLAQGPTRAYGAAKRLLLASATAGLEGQMEAESRAIAATGATADGREGVRAFAAKRPPAFEGR